ncbi:hypothetical protein EKG37_06420 [Robertmurraya yapensis]|uniref:YxiJ-like protein n=2 Tax=Bacillaceae TaxID=186817 RepID=A0A3S0IET8_9BACI|nr:YxiJ family protein [Bacillus yapensis]RTR33852.1 hypothetical protein EKG37_06420 [Bacillus yapensis]TKS97170.1 hypothetical protein FAR12_06420 [Bacillus yapensis]
MENIVQKLNEIKNKLHRPFPYRDCDRIHEDFQAEFLKLAEEENSLNADFNTYCANIEGTLSYVLKGKTAEIPEGQIALLEISFFDFFQQYRFFETHIIRYTDFLEQYKYHEEARKLLLQVVRS